MKLTKTNLNFTTTINKMPPYTLSPSSLSLLKDCPRCFWLKFNKGIKRPDGPFPSLPSGMDKILKIHFDSFMEKGKLPPELKELDGNVKLFDDKELLEVWRNNLKGIQWKDKDDNLFRGAVDNILKKGNKLIVLDYKTRGFPLKEDTADHYQDQLDIYNLLLRKNSYETEDYAYLLFYHPNKVHENGDVDFHAELVKMKVNVKNAEKIFKKAIKTLKGKIPKGDCEFCRYKENSK
ncbi:hypothetical protein CMO83_03455 [Candidatus Woesearchaeota archaeon]|nr:hypothetical protein [Candidatus Woesearchaeota archaeon]